MQKATFDEVALLGDRNIRIMVLARMIRVIGWKRDRHVIRRSTVRYW